MKNTKNRIMAAATAVMLSLTSLTVYAAAQYDSPEQALMGITGKSLEEISEERFIEGKTYGEIAEDEGRLQLFQEEVFAQKAEILEKMVEDGQISREEADRIIEDLEDQDRELRDGRFGRRNMMHRSRRSGFFGCRRGFDD